MGAGADANIILIAPINEVVLAFITFLRVIGNLITTEFIFASNAIGQVIKFRAQIRCPFNESVINLLKSHIKGQNHQR